MELSRYQQDIVDWVQHGEGNAVVEAVAGSGKTTTLVIAAQYMDGKGIFLAFNKHIADKLKHKLAASTLTASTMHSVGLAALREQFGTRYALKVDAGKYRGYIRSQTWPYAVKQDVLKLVDLVRMYWVENASQAELSARLADLAMEYDVPFTDSRLYTECVTETLNWGEQNLDAIDFTDMLWLPIVRDVPFKSYDWVAVDEAQDLSALQLMVVLRLMRSNGRLLAVGDRRQAIFHFAGANSTSFQTIIDRTNARLLPLSVCYRCPTTVVEKARQYCPQIESPPNAPIGTVSTIQRSELHRLMQPGDMILCRLTHPLLPVCYEFISRRKKAHIRGRNVGEKLEEMIRKALAGADAKMPIGAFMSKFVVWSEVEASRLCRVTPEKSLETVLTRHEDNCQCVTAITQNDSTITTVQDLTEVIGELFSDLDDTTAVTLSTIHRAKGLESRRVAIIPAEWQVKKPTSVQIEQEDNLKYVAITRAQEGLYYVK